MDKNQTKKYKNYKLKTIIYTWVSVLITIFLVLYSRFPNFGVEYWQIWFSIMSVLIIIFSILGLMSLSHLTNEFGGRTSLTMCHLFLWGTILLPSFFTLLVIDKSASPLSWRYLNNLNPLLIITIILILIGVAGPALVGITVKIPDKNTLSISNVSPKGEMQLPFYKTLKKLNRSSYTLVTWVIILLLLIVIWYKTPIKQFDYNEENLPKYFSIIEMVLCGFIILTKWIYTIMNSNTLENRDGFLETNRADLEKVKFSSKINLLGVPLALATKTAIKNYEENSNNISNELKTSKNAPIEEKNNEYIDTLYKDTSYDDEGSIDSLKLKIDKLNRLKETGIISQEEYENQRKKLISKNINN